MSCSDIVNGDGSGGESIYGEPFDDENFDLGHKTAGLLSMCGSPPMRDKFASMASHVPHNNTSQFVIQTKARNQAQGGSAIPHWDGRHVVFGRVAEGMTSVHAIQKSAADFSKMHAILDEVVIVDCGELKSKAQLQAEREAASIAPTPRRAQAAAEANVDGARDGAKEAPPKPPHVPLPRPPPPKPTAEDEAIISAEVDDD